MHGDRGAWSGAVHLGSGWLVYAGPLGTAEAHAHHAVQVVVAPDPVSVVDGEGLQARGRHLVVPADRPHALDGGAGTGLVAYLDPSLVGPVAPQVEARDDLPPLVAVDGIDAAEAWADAVAAALGRAPRAGRDELVRAAVTAIRTRLPDRVRLAEVAASIGCSPSSLTHRFSAQVGIPMRRWVLWERLLVAGRHVAVGDRLTEAAHAAGFADSAHLNRTFRRMFGLAPSEIAGAVTWHVRSVPERSSAPG